MAILTLETKKYPIKIDNFEGPIDLLLYLIEKNKMDIYEINLTEITEQYMEYLNKMQELNLEIASEFLVMASTLLYLKSKNLLPKQEEEEEITEEELIRRIVEYKKFKEMSKIFKENYEEFSKRIFKGPEDIELPKKTLEEKYDKNVIPEIYKEIVERTSVRLNQNAKNIEKIALVDTYTVGSKVKEMFKILIKSKKFVFNKVFSLSKRNKQEVVTAFTGLLTPLGDTPYTYLYKTMQGNTTQNINEHLPMTLSDQLPIMCTLIIFLAILIFTKAKIKLSDLFMLGGLTYLMLTSRRQLTMFAIMGSIVLGRLIVDMFKRYNTGSEWLLEKLVKPVGMVVLICVMGLFSLNYMEPKIKLKQSYIDETAYPVKACDYILNESGIDLSKARFYNEYNYGSYMLFRGIPVFIDSRADLYSPEFNGLDEDIFMDFINTSNIGVFYEDTFEKYGITHVICYKNAKMNMIITKTNDPNYNLLYSDNNFVVYERLSGVEQMEEQNDNQ